jgi:hypothetical protein
MSSELWIFQQEKLRTYGQRRFLDAPRKPEIPKIALSSKVIVQAVMCMVLQATSMKTDVGHDTV